MATVNKRVYHPQAMTVNGVAAGGVLTVAVQEGYEKIMRSSPDGLEGPLIVDRECQFCRGSIVVQDWIEAINLLLGTIGTCVFYERKGGTAAATGYTKHTLTNPVIHSVTININKAGYATVAVNFECKAADETKTLADMHAMEDSQAAPSYVSAARGGYRISAAAHGGSIDIYHLMSFSFNLALMLKRACNDSDIAYTCVDAALEGMTVNGTIGFQDSEIATAQLKAQQLLLASAGDLVLTIVQGSGASAKTLTVANVLFTGDNENSNVNADFSNYSLNYEVANDPETPLTLDGLNKIITIA